MSKRDDGGLVFPNVVSGKVIDGLTVRQFYKGMCSAGLLARSLYCDDMMPGYAGRMADALVAEDKEAQK